jgi:hypothetical protein
VFLLRLLPARQTLLDLSFPHEQLRQLPDLTNLPKNRGKNLKNIKRDAKFCLIDQSDRFYDPVEAWPYSAVQMSSSARVLPRWDKHVQWQDATCLFFFETEAISIALFD